ncbi:MAG: AraC family transcriptional regulator [Halofilum sp. (in: g-proteobacteria)]|nr:AraC family transcriptional regulator [Halofilum sp. (in: g-proteobacteria)]
MLEQQQPDEPRRLGFLLLPRFSLLSLLSALEPLRGANRTLGYTAYDWQLFATDPGPVAASNGIPIAPAAAIDAVDDFPAVAVLASYDPLAAVDRRVCRWLRRLQRQGTELGGVETGATVLAHCGLLSGRRVTLHWETLEAFRETHLDVDARDSLYEIDPPVFTCSGGTASMDLMLHLVARHHGDAVARGGRRAVPARRDPRGRQPPAHGGGPPGGRLGPGAGARRRDHARPPGAAARPRRAGRALRPGPAPPRAPLPAPPGRAATAPLPAPAPGAGPPPAAPRRPADPRDRRRLRLRLGGLVRARLRSALRPSAERRAPWCGAGGAAGVSATTCWRTRGGLQPAGARAILRIPVPRRRLQRSPR